MVNTRISIIIPAYNEARTLAACLDAIGAQTIQPYEVIVVDNNSNDETVKIAEQYPFVRVIHEDKQGIVYARNAGFSVAIGDVLARIDADTRLPRNWVELVINFYRDPVHDHFALTGGCAFYNLRSGHFAGRMYDLVVHRLNRVLIGYYFPWGSNSAIPKHAWQAVEPAARLRTDIHEDFDLGIHLAEAGFTTVYYPHLRVGARAKRILDHHNELWPYVAMWPRTLRVNHKRIWPFVWPLACCVWLGSYGIFVTELVLRSLKKPSRARRESFDILI